EWLLLREREDDGTPFIHFKNIKNRTFIKLVQREKDVALVVYHQQESTQRCVAGNCVNGHGTMLYENGDVYVGQFFNSQRIGIGKYSW
ncbi:hypothetical protein NL393_35140, partial [Klebsiella pneumoniae]|nr:hypothetical protein [Klebsiella pneumoniae]